MALITSMISDAFRNVRALVSDILSKAPTVGFRAATFNDLEAICSIFNGEVDRGSFPGFQQPAVQVFRSAIAGAEFIMNVAGHAIPHRLKVFVASLRGKIIGFAVTKHQLTPLIPGPIPANAEAWLIAVTPPFQRRGVGYGLLRYQVDQARLAGESKLFARCFPTATAGQNLLQKAGFSPTRNYPDGAVFELAL